MGNGYFEMSFALFEELLPFPPGTRFKAVEMGTWEGAFRVYLTHDDIPDAEAAIQLNPAFNRQPEVVFGGWGMEKTD